MVDGGTLNVQRQKLNYPNKIRSFLFSCNGENVERERRGRAYYYKVLTTMNALKIPPELKKCTQFIRRAEELDKDKSRPESRLVAYYCRQVSLVFIFLNIVCGIVCGA